MKRCASIFGVVILCLVIVCPARGQDYKTLREELVQKQENTRAEIKELNEQIEQFRERLSLAEQKYDRLYRQYEDLKRIIALQQEKIEKLQEEQQHILEEIRLTEREIAQKEQELESLVDDYKKTLSYIYKHGRATHLALILSSASINQMLVRAYYLDKFETYRERQARQIRQAREELELNKARLEEAREKNAAVLAEIQAEKQEQEEKKRLQEKNVELLQRDRAQIKAGLEEKIREREKFESTLAALILEVERIQKEREAEQNTTLASSENFLSDAAFNRIEASFAAQKGQLPWPVDGGTISEHFGSRRHPVYGTITPNLGVEIVTKAQEPVRVIHDGIVIAVQPFVGYGNVIVVKHGKFFTAYGNLSEIMVRKNEILQKGDIIGLAGDETSPRGESIFFMVRENNTNVDPENWITKR
jgi:septal ring factor EnvC (AmiA/AmiB activator)